MPRRIFEFKCKACGNKFDREAELEDVQACVNLPDCPECGSAEAVKRVYTFGQFTFKGGLPSNHGRDPMKIWR